VGNTRDFVLGQGFEEIEGYTALLARDGSRRLIAELFADPDRPAARPQEAYQELLASCAPGWTARLLQVTWPDPAPRRAFLAQVEAWRPAEAGEPEGLAAIGQGLRLFLEAFPLPYRRRTLLEFVLPPGEASLGWWGGLGGMLRPYGLALVPLGQDEITALAQRLLNPELE
jgi:hypothetical protein